MGYGITVYQTGTGGRRADLAYFTQAATAPEMEDTVTRLHREFPAPGFVVEVEPTPVVSWRGGPTLDHAAELAYLDEQADYDS